jgi:hypothetical protein
MQEKLVYSVRDVLEIFGYKTSAGFRTALRRGQLKLRYLRRGNSLIFTRGAVEEALAELDSRAQLAAAAEVKIESEVAQAALEKQACHVRKQIGCDEAEVKFLEKYALK